MVKVFASNPKVKGSNLMGHVMCGQQWYLTEYSPIEFLKYVPRLIMWPTYVGSVYNLT
jgi:hypothetical protein